MDLFGTAGIRGDARERVTPRLALAVGRAVGEDAESVVVGRDGRETGAALTAAVEAGLESAGATVRRAGVVPTPALAFASKTRHGVQVTASHNPPRDNGLKLFADGEEFDAEAEARIADGVEARIADGVEAERPPAAWDEWGDPTEIDPLPAYRRSVADYAREHGPAPEGLTVVVDCGNGVGGLATPQVLRLLGARVIALNANVDGHFPGRPSKPTPETLADLRAFVADCEGPVVGIGHDGDADRLVVVDDAGEVVHEDTILAVLAEHFVRASDVDDPVVVTTPNASGRIDERIDAASGRVERVRLGALHEGIAAARAGGGDVVFAGEPWKHVHPGLGPWIDGVASAAVLAVLIADRGLADLRAPVSERPYEKVAVDCPDDAKAEAMALVADRLPCRYPEASVGTDHGVRLDFEGGAWTLVRPSGTEPYLRVYAESEDVESLVAGVVEVVERAVEDASA